MTLHGDVVIDIKKVSTPIIAGFIGMQLHWNAATLVGIHLY